jgi:hypothetical protein
MLITTTVATEIAALKERLEMAFILMPEHRPSSASALPKLSCRYKP